LTISNVAVYEVGNTYDTNNYGIFLYQAMDAELYNFNIYNCTRAGLAIMAGAGPFGHNVTVHHGIVRNNGTATISSVLGSGGVQIIAYHDGALDNTSLYNVDIYGNYGAATDNNAKRGGLVIRNDIGTNDAPIYIKNCIISHNDTYDIQVDERNGNFTALTLDNNLYYRAAGTGFVNDGADKSFAQWQALGYDSSSINSDPLYVTNGSNFHLQASSPAINAGVDVGLTSDYLGNGLYGAAWDIGAYELQSDYVAPGGDTPTHFPSFPSFPGFPGWQ
jgi:hypothetical protein